MASTGNSEYVKRLDSVERSRYHLKLSCNKAAEIDLKKAAKVFAQKYSCGSSVTGDDEIVIQGDVLDDLLDFIPEKWPEIDEDSIDDLGDQKR